jgi:hypothetical protein
MKMMLPATKFSSLFLFLLVSFVSAREDDLIGRTQCYTAFALAGFDVSEEETDLG